MWYVWSHIYPAKMYLIWMDLSICVYILTRHSVVISLLPWFCRDHKTGKPFVHCYFILYMCYTWLCVVVLLYSLWLHRASSICGQAYFDITSQRWQVTVLASLTNHKYMPQLLPPSIENQGAWVECILHWLLWITPIITQIIKNYDHLCLKWYILLLPLSKKVGTPVNGDINRHSCTLYP